jgi:hypothetical protein
MDMDVFLAVDRIVNLREGTGEPCRLAERAPTLTCPFGKSAHDRKQVS